MFEKASGHPTLTRFFCLPSRLQRPASSILPTSIATRTGDDGTTGLLFGAERVPKDDPRVEAVGRLDEFNAALGLAKVSADPALREQLETLQRALVPLMGEVGTGDAARYLADARFPHLDEPDLDRVDALVADLEGRGLRFDGWATPGGTPLAAALDLARVAARRAERQMVTLRGAGYPLRPLLLRYVNRVSDALWLLARQAEQ